jgi:hypothetical protein
MLMALAEAERITYSQRRELSSVTGDRGIPSRILAGLALKASDLFQD